MSDLIYDMAKTETEHKEFPYSFTETHVDSCRLTYRLM